MSYNDKTFLAVIPARKGSRRLKHKNMRLMCGKPLIHWAIQTAKDAEIFDEIVVMSDDEKIHHWAVNKENIRAFNEPPNMAIETAYVGDALIQLINFYKEANQTWDYVQLIEPTAPLLRPAQIRNAIKFMFNKNADFVISMCSSESSNGVIKTLPEDLCVRNWWPQELFAKRSQDCPTMYRVDGLIYVGKREIWLQRNYWDSNIFAWITDNNDSVDINNIRDFEHAEAILQYRLQGHRC